MSTIFQILREIKTKEEAIRKQRGRKGEETSLFVSSCLASLLVSLIELGEPSVIHRYLPTYLSACMKGQCRYDSKKPSR